MGKGVTLKLANVVRECAAQGPETDQAGATIVAPACWLAMETYELKLFGPRDVLAPVRLSLGRHAFHATDNLSAIVQAKAEFAMALPGCDYAYLHHLGDGTIWEGHAPHPHRASSPGAPET